MLPRRGEPAPGAIPLPTICSARPAVPAVSTATRNGFAQERRNSEPDSRPIDHDAVAAHMRLGRLGRGLFERRRFLIWVPGACMGEMLVVHAKQTAAGEGWPALAGHSLGA